MSAEKPILITGSHRSGSTWVGRMIAVSSSVGYIQEPFNIQHDIGICGARFDHWFTYVSKQNENDFYNLIKNSVGFRYNWEGKFKSISNLKDIASMIVRSAQFYTYRYSHVRPLLKDPIALFSADWLASRFDMDVVVIIRHPAAFVASLKAKNWIHPFSHFMAQPLLIEDHLSLFKTEIKKLAEENHDIIDQAALLWILIHHVIRKYQENHKNWIFVRQEDLSQNPRAGFKEIFNRLGLEFTPRVERTIEKYSGPSGSNHFAIHKSILRDSRSNVWNWKTRLTKTQVKRIRVRVQDISRAFYSEEEWE